MKRFNQKLVLIFVPFLIIAIGVTCGYTFLNWLLFIKLHAFSLKEDTVNIWIPFALPWIPILIWLRPRIKLLNLKRRKGDLPALYIIVSGFAMAIPTIIAQTYLETASGRLTQLNNVNQIEKQEATKYYALKKFYLDKSNIGVQSVFDVSGKNNEHFNMNLYIVLPILATPDDTAGLNCTAWYGIKYHEQISNRLDPKEKEERYREFANESQADFDKKNVDQFIYLDRIGNTDDHQGYISAIKENKKYSGGSTTVLVPVNEPFQSRNGNKLAWIFGSLAIGSIIWLIMIAIPKFDKAALEKSPKQLSKRGSDARAIIKFFLPREGFFITPIILDLNILVFLLMVFSGLGFVSFRAVDLLAWGGNFKPYTSNGEWWRIVTNIFLHGGVMHLLANMYGLLFVGIFLEPRLGKTKYAISYLVTGIIASVTSLLWHDATVSVGASGAIFGLYGIFLALLLTKAFPKPFSKTFLSGTIIFIGYNLLMGLTGGIDNAAHIGGLISGFVTGLILYPRLSQHSEFELLIKEPKLHNAEETTADGQ